METMKRGKKYNFGKWCFSKLHEMDRPKSWLINRANLSAGSLHRWYHGSQPRLDKFLDTCKAIAKVEKVPLEKIVLEALEDLPEFWEGRK